MPRLDSDSFSSINASLRRLATSQVVLVATVIALSGARNFSVATIRSTVLTVFVTDAQSRQPLAGANVNVPTARLNTWTDDTGRAIFPRLEPGLLTIVVTHSGYSPVSMRVIVGLSDSTDLLLSMKPAVSTLDTIRVSASRTPEYLADFYARRHMGLGRFLTSEQLDSVKAESLADLAARHFTGLRAVWAIDRTSVTLKSMRGFYALGKSSSKQVCEVQVYIDEMLASDMDLAALRAGDVAGVEYYSNAPPVKYTRMGPACGVMVVWTWR